jgi:hypothetical protein
MALFGVWRARGSKKSLALYQYDIAALHYLDPGHLDIRFDYHGGCILSWANHRI